jgi:rubredoxin
MIKMFKCSVCGYIHIGGEAPEKWHIASWPTLNTADVSHKLPALM